MRRSLLLALVAPLVASCATASPDAEDVSSPAPTGSETSAAGYTPLVLDEAPDGLVDGTLVGPDGEREVVLHVPEGGGEGAPLVLGLHPFGFDGPQFDRLTDLGRLGADRGAVVAFPSGIGGAWNASRSCCPPATAEEIDDVGFLTALVADLHDQLGTDPTRTSAVGFSNGGYMAVRLACETPDTVGAIASHAASLDLTCEPGRPVSVLVSHGVDDPVVPFSQARPLVDTWLGVDGCPEPTSTEPFDLLAAPCEAETAVALRSWNGLGHAWPTAFTEEALTWVSERGRA